MLSTFGAHQFDRVKKSLGLAVKSATMIALAGFAVFLIFPGPILRVFSTDAELVKMGTTATRWLVLGLPLVGYQQIGTSFFQALGKAKPAVFLALSRQVLFLIPMVIILSHLLVLVLPRAEVSMTHH